VKLLDVNVVLAAHRADHPDHTATRAWLDDLLARGESFGVPWHVWWSFVRLSTHPKIFSEPTPLSDLLAFIEAIRGQPAHILVAPGGPHLDHLRFACEQGEASGDLVPDATLVALAREHYCEIVSYDRDFARFPGITWSRPVLDGD
jgi:toxin-antitoxin system PIN domain toxin